MDKISENVRRFVNYAKIDTQADDTTGTTPSTEKQKNLGRLLVKELLELGLEDAHMDEWGNVYGHLPGEGKKIGLNAHMDTALEVTDEGVNPQLVEKFDGSPIKYPNGIVMDVESFPSLKRHIGHDLITTDGNTLLGADDKAGIAIIMSTLTYLHAHPEVKHHNLSICFTVDEEIGEGPLHFNYEKMGADFAYTIDGADINFIEYENFNAKGVTIDVTGVSIHPGSGKDKLVNAILVANEIIELLPHDQTPFDSEGYQGFWHLTHFEGSAEVAKFGMIVRDFEKEGIEKRIKLIEEAVKKVQEKWPTAQIKMDVKYQYENMRPYVDKNPEAVNRAKSVLEARGHQVVCTGIRGGTDGATFSKNGLVTPNLGTGSYNHHGRFEYLDVQEFEEMINIVLDIVKL